MSLRLRCERAAELTADPRRHAVSRRLPPQRASLVPSLLHGPDWGVPRMRSPPCAGDRFLVSSSPATEQIYEHPPNSMDIYYPAAEAV